VDRQARDVVQAFLQFLFSGEVRKPAVMVAVLNDVPAGRQAAFQQPGIVKATPKHDNPPDVGLQLSEETMVGTGGCH
jgi:hypothetical protein